MSVDEAAQAINKHLSQYLDNPSVSVDVFSYASKKYYVISAGAGNGDTIQSFLVTGNETALTAIAQVQGISQFANKKMWIARPTPAGEGCDQILPIDYDAIVRGGVRRQTTKSSPVIVYTSKKTTCSRFRIASAESWNL